MVTGCIGTHVCPTTRDFLASGKNIAARRIVQAKIKL